MNWRGPYDNPFAAARACAIQHGINSALELSLCRIADWADFEERNFLDDVLQEIGGDTNIVVQKRDEDWYACLDVDMREELK